jgi:hypothetical protein
VDRDEGGNSRVYLFYCGAGEHCIGVAELIFSGAAAADTTMSASKL